MGAAGSANYLGGGLDPRRSRPVTSGECHDEAVAVVNKLTQNATSGCRIMDQISTFNAPCKISDIFRILVWVLE